MIIANADAAAVVLAAGWARSRWRGRHATRTR